MGIWRHWLPGSSLARSVMKRRGMTRLTGIRLAAAALAALLSLVACPAFASTPGEARSVFIVGDSHVQMLGPTLTHRLEDEGVEVAGYESRPGWSTRAYQRRGDLTEVLEQAGRPEIVVVSLGGNDFVGSEESYFAQLAWIVDHARAAGAEEIIWLGPAHTDAEAGEVAARTAERHERNANLQAELLPALGVTWVDSRPLTLEHHGRDGIHFTRSGYSAWAHGALPTVTDAVHPDAVVADTQTA